MIANSPSNSHLRIFISYGHDEHTNFALKLKEDLQARGHEVWFDLDKLKPGMEWERYIEEGINWASRDGNGRVILLMTPHSVRRPDGFCLNELARALAKNLKVIPVILVSCEPPLSICRIQRLDMRDCLPLEERREKYEVKFGRLLEALELNRLDLEGFQSNLFNVLNPLSFDSEVRYNLDRFTGRDWVFEAVDRWLDDAKASRLFWISGGPGVGKTALSSYLVAHQPEIVAFHFCRYDNVQKRDPRRAVMSLAYQLSTQLPAYAERLGRAKLDDLGGRDAKTLFDDLIVQPLAANFPPPGVNIVILIDALDEATVDGKNEMASFIASGFERTPQWLRLIITSRPNPEVMGPLQAYTPFMIDINDPRNDRDINAYLTGEIKKLKADVKPEVIEAIAKKSGGLFLYAEWVVAELGRGRLSLDRLDEFPQGLGGIYLKFFERQFPDLVEWENTIAPALDITAAFQEPLSVELLSTILSWNARDRRKFQHALGALFSFNGGIQPFHKSVMDWLMDESKQDPYYVDANEGNRLLAEYLWQEYKNKAWSHYLISYLPQHLFKAQRWKDLEALLLDMKFIAAAVEADRWRLTSQLVSINERSPLKLNTIYGTNLPLEGNDEKGLLALADLLVYSSYLDEGERILGYLIPRYRQSSDLISLSRALGIMYWVPFKKFHFKEAFAITLEQEEVSRKAGDKKSLVDALSHKCNILSYSYEYERAVATAEELERVSREIGDSYGLAISLHTRGMAKMYTRDGDRALFFFDEGERICRSVGLLLTLAVFLMNQGYVYIRKGDYKMAMTKLEEATNICQQIRYLPALCIVLAYKGAIYESMGRLDEAMSIYEEGAKLSSVWNKGMLSMHLAGQGRVFNMKNRTDEALTFVKRSMEVAMQSGDAGIIETSLGSLAVVLAAKGDTDGARDALERREKICREKGVELDLLQTQEQLRALRSGEKVVLKL